jgi:flagellar basal body rod protein FlgG
MMRSLFAGVSGLRNHQVQMDVIGNNIANVNTVAFKASRVTFKEAFAQLVQGASRPPGNVTDVAGGRNPVQVGLGMNIGSIDLLFTQGNLQATGVTTDLAIQGDAFFVVSDGAQRYYTRSTRRGLRRPIAGTPTLSRAHQPRRRRRVRLSARHSVHRLLHRTRWPEPGAVARRRLRG